MTESEKARTKKLIVRHVKKYLHNAREKEKLLLEGLALVFCHEHGLKPEQIELVRRDHKGTNDSTFFFRKRADAILLLPKGEAN